MAATFAIDHNEFVGVRQARGYVGGEPCEPIAFKPSGIYGCVRHPNTSTLIAFVWTTPHMTLGHLLFTGALTAYAWIGTTFEERSLVRLYPTPTNNTVVGSPVSSHGCGLADRQFGDCDHVADYERAS